jgi:hypothetical protein
MRACVGWKSQADAYRPQTGCSTYKSSPRAAIDTRLSRRTTKSAGIWLEEMPLEGTEEVFGLGEGQPEMLDALMVLVEGEDIGDGLFLTLIITHDELQFEAHTGASPGSSDR